MLSHFAWFTPLPTLQTQTLHNIRHLPKIVLSRSRLFDLERSFVLSIGEIFIQRLYEVLNVYTKIVKKESTSLVQTGFDKTRNCGENRDWNDWKIDADSCPHDFVHRVKTAGTPNKLKRH